MRLLPPNLQLNPYPRASHGRIYLKGGVNLAKKVMYIELGVVGLCPVTGDEEQVTAKYAKLNMSGNRYTQYTLSTHSCLIGEDIGCTFKRCPIAKDHESKLNDY